MTSEEKLADIQRQCDEMWEKGRELDLRCPYCYHVTPAFSGEGPCCRLMDMAVKSIIERAKAVEEGMKSYERRQFGRLVMGDKYVQ